MSKFNLDLITSTRFYSLFLKFIFYNVSNEVVKLFSTSENNLSLAIIIPWSAKWEYQRIYILHNRISPTANSRLSLHILIYVAVSTQLIAQHVWLNSGCDVILVCDGTFLCPETVLNFWETNVKRYQGKVFYEKKE